MPDITVTKEMLSAFDSEASSNMRAGLHSITLAPHDVRNMIARIRELEAEKAKLNKDCRHLQDKNSQMAQEWSEAMRNAARDAVIRERERRDFCDSVVNKEFIKETRVRALEEAAEAANGVEPALLEGKSELVVSIYCRSRVDAAAAIRSLTVEEGERMHSIKINLADEPVRWKCTCGHAPCDGLDCGVYLPGQEPRRKPLPKPPEEISAIRAQAWATRRAKYGRHGHRW